MALRYDQPVCATVIPSLYLRPRSCRVITWRKALFAPYSRTGDSCRNLGLFSDSTLADVPFPPRRVQGKLLARAHTRPIRAIGPSGVRLAFRDSSCDNRVIGESPNLTQNLALNRAEIGRLC